MTAPVTQSLDPSLLDKLELQQEVKACYDASVQLYADNGLLPQFLADEMKRNMTGAELVKWVLTQVENSPYIRIPTGNQIVAQRDLPPFHDNRPDCLDARVCALRYADIPNPLRNSFAKISTTDGQPLISAGGLTFLAANNPTED